MNTNKNKKNNNKEITLIDIMATIIAFILFIASIYFLSPIIYDFYKKTSNNEKTFEKNKPNFTEKEFCSYFPKHEICENICEYNYNFYQLECDYTLITQKQKEDMIEKLKEEYNNFKTKKEEKEKNEKNKEKTRIKNIPNIKI